MSYFDRQLPTTLILGSFFAVFLPLVLLTLFAGGLPWLPYVLMAQAVGLGTTHFFITLALYLQSANLDYFVSTWRNRVVYFVVPAAFFLFFAWSEAARFRDSAPLLAAYVFGGLRFLDFFHVGRQSVGMLQLWKRSLQAGLPAWSRSAENAVFVGLALLQWETFLLGGRFAGDKPYAVVPAAAIFLLFVITALAHAQHALRSPGGGRRFVPLVYFAMQALCATTAVYQTRLYLIALTLHYVEYHVIMMPRCLRTPLRPERAVDRVSAFLRRSPLWFYGALLAVVVLFELRNQVPAGVSASTAFFVHIFDGVFVVHYFVEAFLWKFGNPHYRAVLGPLYFAPAPAAATASAFAPGPAVLPEPRVPEIQQEAAAAASASAPEPEVEQPVEQPALAPEPHSAARTVALCAAFAASGAAALAFETLWFHQAGLAFGNGVWASSLVLSGFMAGMGLGNWLAARHGDRLGSGLRVYAGLELLIAISGVALVYALPASGGLLAPLAAAGFEQTLPLNALRLLLAFALLLVPATAMGATLPVLVRAVRGWDPNFGRVLGLLYGTNTAGAVLGVLATELALLPAFGVRGSAWLAATLGVAAAAIAWSVARRLRANGPALGPVASVAPRPRVAGGSELPWLVAAFAAGFAMLALEVVWLRFVMLFINDTPLAFALILAAVLAGIALGGFAASLWSSASQRLADYAPLLAYATGLGGIGGYLLYGRLLARSWAPDQDAATILAVIAPLVLPAAFGSGVLFAALGAGLWRRDPAAARATGRLALANTIGGGLGALLAGFVLLPHAGMELSLLLLFALYGAIGIVLGLGGGLRLSLRLGGLALFALALCFFPYGDMRSVYVRASVGRWMSPADRLVEVREGLTGTLAHVVHGLNGLPLFDQLATNAYSMSVNDFAGRRYMKLFVVLPTALHPRIERALVVGYGVGNTVQALAASSELRRIEVVDISRDVLALGRRIGPLSGRHPLDDRRVHVQIEDGRYFLQTTREHFDLITGEPPPPIMAGVVNLYTREYFALVRDRLRAGGMASYWLPTMNISAATAKSLIAGFCAAFEDCSLWHGSAANFMLLGTRDAGARGPVSRERFEQQWSDARAQPELVAIGLEQPAQLGALFIGDAAYLRELTADAPPLSDDQPKRMHQPGTREEREALTWQWRDTSAARLRFARSALVARLFPEDARRAALPQFENQRLLNDLLFPGQTAARQTRVLHQVLHGTQLRLPVLLLLGSDPDIQAALARARPDAREQPVWLRHRAAGALAARDFGSALQLLERTPDDQLPLPDLREYVRYVVRRGR